MSTNSESNNLSRRSLLVGGLQASLVVTGIIKGVIPVSTATVDPRRAIVGINEEVTATAAVQAFQNASTAKLMHTFASASPAVLAQGMEGLRSVKEVVNTALVTEKPINPHRAKAYIAMTATGLLLANPATTEQNTLSAEISDALNARGGIHISGYYQTVLQSIAEQMKVAYDNGQRIAFPRDIVEAIGNFIPHARDELDSVAVVIAVDTLLNARWILNQQGEDTDHITDILRKVANDNHTNAALAAKSIRYFESISDKLTSPTGAFSVNTTDWHNRKGEQGAFLYGQVASRLEMMEDIFNDPAREGAVDPMKPLKASAFWINHLSDASEDREFREFLVAEGLTGLADFNNRLPGLLQDIQQGPEAQKFIEFERGNGWVDLAPFSRFVGAGYSKIIRDNTNLDPADSASTVQASVISALKEGKLSALLGVLGGLFATNLQPAADKKLDVTVAEVERLFDRASNQR